MEAYGPLAEWFEYLNDDCDYASWSQYFIDGLSTLGAGPCGLELGCGSGAFCRLLTRAGYRMEGADLSPAMLTKAEQLAREEGLRIPFFRVDASALKAPKQYDFILSPNDCFNYIPQKSCSPPFRMPQRRSKRAASSGWTSAPHTNCAIKLQIISLRTTAKT